MKIKSSFSTIISPLAFSVIGIVLSTGCGSIHRPRMPVSDSLLQATDTYPVSKENGRLQFADYTATMKSGWDSSNSWRVFGIGKDTYQMPVIITLQDQTGAAWKGQCAYSYSAVGVDPGWEFNIKEGLACEYMDVKTNAVVGIPLSLQPFRI